MCVSVCGWVWCVFVFNAKTLERYKYWELEGEVSLTKRRLTSSQKARWGARKIFCLPHCFNKVLYLPRLLVLEPSKYFTYTYTEKVKSSKNLNWHLTQWPRGQGMFIKPVSWSWKLKKHGGSWWGGVKVSDHETPHSTVLMYFVLTNSHPVAHINEVAIKSQD